QKITGAMKLVAASKLRKAQEAITAQRPYAIELGQMLRRVASRTETAGGAAPHPLLEIREPKRVLLVVVTSDRGLCGAFNANIIREAEKFIAEEQGNFTCLDLATIGRKGAEYFKRHTAGSVQDHPGIFEDLNFRHAREIAEKIAERYMEVDLDAVYVLFNQFNSAISQSVQVERLLPVVQDELPEGPDVEYEYEPSQASVLEQLVPRYVTTLLWRALLDSSAAEHGARMTAMDNASRNAKEIVDNLTLKYNRARQSAITMELMDIVGGAEALNG
ncbi:MAG: ATP synthase F1 subunit gamma, partial [Myxococcota bacterium]